MEKKKVAIVTLGDSRREFYKKREAIVASEIEKVKKAMSLRAEYFGEEGEAGPFVYNNGEYIGTLKKNIDMAEKIPYNRSK